MLTNQIKIVAFKINYQLINKNEINFQKQSERKSFSGNYNLKKKKKQPHSRELYSIKTYLIKKI